MAREKRERKGMSGGEGGGKEKEGGRRGEMV